MRELVFINRKSDETENEERLSWSLSLSLSVWSKILPPVTAFIHELCVLALVVGMRRSKRYATQRRTLLYNIVRRCRKESESVPYMDKHGLVLQSPHRRRHSRQTNRLRRRSLLNDSSWPMIRKESRASAAVLYRSPGEEYTRRKLQGVANSSTGFYRQYEHVLYLFEKMLQV